MPSTSSSGRGVVFYLMSRDKVNVSLHRKGGCWESVGGGSGKKNGMGQWGGNGVGRQKGETERSKRARQ